MAKETPARGILIYKKNIPKDVYSILLKKQGEIKSACGCMISFEKTIYNLLKFVKDKNINQ